MRTRFKLLVQPGYTWGHRQSGFGGFKTLT